jgi:hypothetical protein
MTTEVVQKTQWVILNTKYDSDFHRWQGISRPRGTLLWIVREGKMLLCAIECVQVGDYLTSDHNGESDRVSKKEFVYV